MTNSINLICLGLALLALHYWRELQICRGREAELRQRLKSSPGPSGTTLPGQLNSHFLFNALNTIRYFIRTNSTTAREMLLDLSLVLQAALRRENSVSLRDELEGGRAYLRLERARLGTRLEILDQIGELDLDLLVPAQVLPQLLQALVNGVAARSSGGTIRLEYRDRTLRLEGDGEAEVPGSLGEALGGRLRVTSGVTTTMEWRVSE